MGKRKKEPEKEREKERQYSQQFLRQLEGTSTFDAAMTVAYKDMPLESGVGRLRHSNLLHLLSGLDPTRSQPPYRLNRNYPLAPNGATNHELAAYKTLFVRLTQSGEINKEDAECAERLLSAAHPRFDLW